MNPISESVDHSVSSPGPRAPALEREILCLRQQNHSLQRENAALRQDLARAKQIIGQLEFLLRRHI